MIGLMIKDLKLIKGQRYFFLVFLAMAVCMQTFMDSISFIIGYMTFFGSIFVLNTISYDEFDNGNAFLFSLPISRKGYVLEKYAFGFIMGGAAWLFAVIIAVVLNCVKLSLSVKDMVIIALMYLVLLAIILSVMLPVQFKFGGEKRVYVIMAVGCIAGIIVFATIVIARHLKIDLSLVLSRLSTISSGIMVAAMIVIAALAVLLSCRISIAIMNKKEF